MIQDVLRKAGFTEAEVKVYLALTQLGSSSLGPIQEKVKVERRYLYDVLNKLIEKGLASYTIERGKKTFQITHPNKILSYLEEQKNVINTTQKEMQNELPQLIDLYTANKPSIKAEILRGKEGIKALGEDLLTCKDNYFIGGNGSVQNYMPFFWEHFNKKRIEKKILWHDLIVEGTLMEQFKSLAKARTKLKERQFYEYRVLPSKLASPPVTTIYGDKVALTLWQEEPFTILIQNPEIANSYLNYFKFLWELSGI